MSKNVDRFVFHIRELCATPALDREHLGALPKKEVLSIYQLEVSGNKMVFFFLVAVLLRQTIMDTVPCILT